jgi:hypothetical protein
VELAELAAVEHAVAVAGALAVVEGGGEEAAVGTNFIILNDADEVDGGARGRDRAGSGAAAGEGLGDEGVVLGVLLADRQEEGVSLLGVGGHGGREDHAGDDVIGHAAADLGEAELAGVGLVQGDIGLPERGRPDLAGVVDLAVGLAAALHRVILGEGLAVADVAEGEGVLLEIDGVGDAADPKVRGGIVVGVGGAGVGAVEIVALAQGHVQAEEVAPALALRPAGDVAAVDEAHMNVVTPLVGDDHVVDGAVALGAGEAAELGVDLALPEGVLEGEAAGVGDRGGGDRRIRGVGVGAERGRVVLNGVVRDDHADGARGLGVGDLDLKGAVGAVDQGDLARQIAERWLAAVVGIDAFAVGEEDDLALDFIVLGAELRVVGDDGLAGRPEGEAGLEDEAAPQVHLHARRLAVAGGHHVGVVAVAGEGAVLRLGAHAIVLLAAAAVIAELGGAGGLVEARVVPPVVQPINVIKKLDGGGHRLLRRGEGREA